MYDDDYIALVDKVITYGQMRTGRNGPTLALFGESLTITSLCYNEFPLLTTRQIFYKGVFGELAAFVRGAITVGDYQEWGCNYWAENAKAWAPNRHTTDVEDMVVGQIYGAQWTNWEQTGYNQLRALINGIKTEPHSRRHVITTFSPTAQACLPPCHLTAQFFVNDSTDCLECLVYMRSVDLILGLPSDVALYAAFLVMLASEVGLQPGQIQFVFGDTHVYENHVDKFRNIQRNQPSFIPPDYIRHRSSLLDFKPADIEIVNYEHAKAIKYDFSV